MKSLIKVLLGAIAFFTFLLNSEKAEAQGGVHISFQTFYDELSPYGDWVHNPAHGYVWVPYAERGFQPYATRGHWVMTEYGNTWVSDYEWGWAPFHYGRWFYDDFYGWAWVPGSEWGPSWVHWRHSNGYYGWAPLGPGVHINVSVNIPVHHWVFVPHRHFTSHRIHHYYVPRRRVTNIYHKTVVINNVYVNNNVTYVSGPSRQDIERRTNRSVTVRTVDYAERPNRSTVNNNSVRIYRPSVSDDKTKARPARVAESASRTSAGARQSQAGRSTRSSVGKAANSSSNNRTREAAPAGRAQQPAKASSNTRTAPTRTSRTESATRATSTAPARENQNTRSTNRVQSNTRTQVQKSQEAQKPASQVQRAPATRTGTSVQSKPAPQRQSTANSASRQPAQKKAAPAKQQSVRQQPSRQTSTRQQPAKQNTRQAPAEKQSSRAQRTR